MTNEHISFWSTWPWKKSHGENQFERNIYYGVLREIVQQSKYTRRTWLQWPTPHKLGTWFFLEVRALLFAACYIGVCAPFAWCALLLCFCAPYCNCLLPWSLCLFPLMSAPSTICCALASSQNKCASFIWCALNLLLLQNLFLSFPLLTLTL